MRWLLTVIFVIACSGAKASAPLGWRATVEEVKADYASGMAGRRLRVVGVDIRTDAQSQKSELVVMVTRPYGVTFPLVVPQDHPSFIDLAILIGHEDELHWIEVTRVRKTPAGNPRVLGSWVEASAILPPLSGESRTTRRTLEVPSTDMPMNWNVDVTNFSNVMHSANITVNSGGNVSKQPTKLGPLPPRPVDNTSRGPTSLP